MKNIRTKGLLLVLLYAMVIPAFAQTDIDGLMMGKNNFCTGPMFQYSAWSNYWEGTLKRDNLNLGTVSTHSVSVMGNYGITRRLNVLFNLPYVGAKASAGQLKEQRGLQDLSFWVKYIPYEAKVGKGDLTLYTLGGFSTPVSKYNVDLLPLSLGLGSKNTTLRLMADYQLGKWFATASGSYVHRSNVLLNRDIYYTTEMHYTNEVKMPDMTSWNLRTGYRHGNWIAEAIAEGMNTLGGFDITRNNMPFISNNMDATRLGINLKRENIFTEGLSIITGGMTTVKGRNIGASTLAYGALVYVFDFSRKKKSNQQTDEQKPIQ